jgi:hypothetical protein
VVQTVDILRILLLCVVKRRSKMVTRTIDVKSSTSQCTLAGFIISIGRGFQEHQIIFYQAEKDSILVEGVGFI